jgi:FlaA1/EpsC-like NDP-sugar epimerase
MQGGGQHDRRPDDRPRVRRVLRVLVPVAVDGSAWAVGLGVAVWTRYEMEVTRPRIGATLLAVVLAVHLHSAAGYLRYLYRGRYAFGSFEEVRAVFTTVVATGGAILAIDLSMPVRLLPASAPIVGGALALILMLAVRYVHRLRRERRLRPDANAATPVVLFGAGTAGRDLLGSMLRDPRGRYLPVGLLDDDPDKANLRLHGVPMLGGRADIAAAVRRTGATTVILSVANAAAGLIRDVRARAEAAGAGFKVLPSISELLDHRAGVADVRDVQVGDLLGRHQIETDLESIAGYLAGKRVLVTGAGGSIGSELCRQIQRFGPRELMMLDRDESALHALQLSLCGRALLDTPELILADLRDETTIRSILAERRPQVVFHAAALKHLPLLERYPGEAVRTNVWGTLAVLEHADGVERFVNISTDKAANPGCVLGYSKRITERLTAYASTVNPGTFLNVRFGNVLGSRGSVLTSFVTQASDGGPITVTHPDVCRYFMTVQEAVQLVIQSGAIGRDGEALVLDMGAPVRIADLARQVADLALSNVDVVYTGLRRGEKLREDLFGVGERDVRPLHPLISHVDVPPLDPAEVRLLDPSAPRAELVAELAQLCAARGFEVRADEAETEARADAAVERHSFQEVVASTPLLGNNLLEAVATLRPPRRADAG